MQYVNFNKLENGDLELRLLPEAKEDLQVLWEEERRGDWYKELEVLDHQLCNGWTWVKPEEIAALVDHTCPILTDDYEDSEDGKEVIHIGTVWAYGDYAIRSFLQDLLDTGLAVFQRVEEEKKPVTLPEYRLENGKLQSYAWPGGYPLYYLDEHNSVQIVPTRRT